MTKTIKVKINNEIDRNNIVTALANSGYKVWIVEEESQQRLYGKTYYVYFELEGNKNGK